MPKARQNGEGSIFRKKGSPFWWVSWTVAGVTHKESTKSLLQGEAVVFLQRKQREAFATGDTFVADRKVKVSDLIDDLFKEYEFENKKSLPWARSKIKPVLSAIGHLQARVVTYQILQRYVTSRLKAGVGNASVNRELALLRRAFHIAKNRAKKIQTIPEFPMKPEPKKRQGFFTADEFQALLKHLPDDLRLFAKLGYCTGARKTEMFTLLWDDVNFKERLVTYRNTKRKNENRTVPITVSLRDELLARKAIRDSRFPNCPWVLFRTVQAGSKPAGNRMFSCLRSWDNACENSGKPEAIMHDLRRTVRRNMRKAGVNDSVIKRIQGHAPADISQGYDVVSDEDMREAVDRTEKYLEREGKGTVEECANPLAQSLDHSTPEEIEFLRKMLIVFRERAG
jgi:integrase